MDKNLEELKERLSYSEIANKTLIDAIILSVDENTARVIKRKHLELYDEACKQELEE